MSPAAPQSGEWKPTHNPWLIAISVMLATFMEILDTSVANVALPHIAGNLSATTDEATWVLTSYLVSNAVVLPMTAWLGRRFGRKRFLITCIFIFTGASLLAGAAPTLPLLIAARVLQGAGGGALQPIAQAVLLESFPPEQRGQAMAAYGMGVVVAPILGPTLGGWITDNFSWRWIFYINLPIGAAAVLMAQRFVEDPPYIRDAPRTGVDYIGFSLMAIWLASLQIVFDKGQEADWFNSGYIVWLSVISTICMFGFIFWELNVKNPIVNLRVLGNRNFAGGTFLITIVGVVLFGTTALLPLFLQTLMGYPALQSGMAVSPRGIGSILSMVVVGRLVGKVDPRILIGGGFLGVAWATFMFGNITLDMSMQQVIIPNILTGFSIGFVFVPLTTLTTATLPASEIGNATGIYNLMRNIGGSMGISGLTSLMTRGTQTHQNLMVGYMNPMSPQFMSTLHGVQQMMAGQLGIGSAADAGYAMMYRMLAAQAALAAYADVFRFMALLGFLSVPLVLIFKPARVKGPVVIH